MGTGVGVGRGLGRLYFSSFPKPQPRNQDSGFSNFGDLPGRLRENQGHYKNTLDTGSNFKFKMPTVIYLLSKKKKTGTFPLTWEICQFFWQTKVDTDTDLVREVNTLILRNPWTSEIFQEHSFCSLCYDQSRQISGQATKTQVKRERSYTFLYSCRSRVFSGWTVAFGKAGLHRVHWLFMGYYLLHV